MRCYICDVAIEKPQFNADHEDWDPCETCKQVIADAVCEAKDRPAVAEDELGEEPLPVEQWTRINDYYEG